MTMHENKIWFTYNLVSLDEQNKHLQARTFYERQKVKDEKKQKPTIVHFKSFLKSLKPLSC
jgi:hypothetical protein